MGSLLSRAHIPDAVGLADRLLGEFGSLGALLSATTLAQQRVAGRESEALALLSDLRETLLYALLHRLEQRPILSTARALIDYLTIAMADLPIEQVRIVYLNGRNHLLRDEILGEGSVDSVAVHPREIIRRSLEVGASGLVLVHNHPSGDPAPSEADRRITRQLAAAAHSFDIVLHDHIVVTPTGWLSFREAGAL